MEEMTETLRDNSVQRPQGCYVLAL